MSEEDEERERGRGGGRGGGREGGEWVGGRRKGKECMEYNQCKAIQ